jgi:hypothetical protein
MHSQGVKGKSCTRGNPGSDAFGRESHTASPYSAESAPCECSSIMSFSRSLGSFIHSFIPFHFLMGGAGGRGAALKIYIEDAWRRHTAATLVFGDGICGRNSMK